MKQMTSSSSQHQRGSFLLESLISVLLFMIGLIALVAVSAQSLSQVGQSKARNDASDLVGELLGEMWISTNAPGAFVTTDWQARVANVLPGGQATVNVTGTLVQVDVSWTDTKISSGAVHHYVTTAQVARN